MKKVNLLSLSVTIAFVTVFFSCRKSVDVNPQTEQKSHQIKQDKSALDSERQVLKKLDVVSLPDVEGTNVPGYMEFILNTSDFPPFVKVWFHTTGPGIAIDKTRMEGKGFLWRYTHLKSESDPSYIRASFTGELIYIIPGGTSFIKYEVRGVVEPSPIYFNKAYLHLSIITL